MMSLPCCRVRAPSSKQTESSAKGWETNNCHVEGRKVWWWVKSSELPSILWFSILLYTHMPSYFLPFSISIAWFCSRHFSRLYDCSIKRDECFIKLHIRFKCPLDTISLVAHVNLTLRCALLKIIGFLWATLLFFFLTLVPVALMRETMHNSLNRECRSVMYLNKSYFCYTLAFSHEEHHLMIRTADDFE